MNPNAYADPRSASVAARQAENAREAQRSRAVCPFGCSAVSTDDDQGNPVAPDCDEHGYCRHLVGFVQEKKKVFEPRTFVPCAFQDVEERHEEIVTVDGVEDIREVVRKKKVPTAFREVVNGFNARPIPKGAKLVPIGNCARVYTESGIEDYDRFAGRIKRQPVPE